MILFVNACVRKKESRTLRLAEKLLEKLDEKVMEIDICNENIKPLTAESLALRNLLVEKEDLCNPIFKYANQFAQSDIIVLAAPYWDMSFPAVVKDYIEHISVCKITFKYDEKGVPQGLCRAKKLYYVTTAGGYTKGMNYGYDYVKAICGTYYGIKNTEFISAEGLDIWGNDAEKIMQKAMEKI